MKHLDLADLVALAAEVSEVEMPKVLELLDTPEVGALLADARPPLSPHAGAAILLTGLAAAPLPDGNRRLALLAGPPAVTGGGGGAGSRSGRTPAASSSSRTSGWWCRSPAGTTDVASRSST